MSAVSAPIFSAPVFVTWSEALASNPGRTPYTKSALDFYLDANLGRDN